MSYHLLHSQKKRISLILPFFIILTMLNGCEDFDALINGVLAFGPALEELAERVSVPYGDVG